LVVALRAARSAFARSPNGSLALVETVGLPALASALFGSLSLPRAAELQRWLNPWLNGDIP